MTRKEIDGVSLDQLSQSASSFQASLGNLSYDHRANGDDSESSPLNTIGMRGSRSPPRGGAGFRGLPGRNMNRSLDSNSSGHLKSERTSPCPANGKPRRQLPRRAFSQRFDRRTLPTLEAMKKSEEFSLELENDDIGK